MDVTPEPMTDEEMADLERQQAEAAAAARWPNASAKQRALYMKNALNPFGGKRGPGRAKQPSKAGAPKPPHVAKGTSSLTKASLHQMLEMGSAALLLGERTRPYALEPMEVDALTDAWYEVIRLYPSMGGYFAVGNKLTAWGQALMITTVVLDRKVKNGQSVQAELAARAAHPDSGTQRNGQDYATAAAAGYPPVQYPAGQ